LLKSNTNVSHVFATVVNTSVSTDLFPSFLSSIFNYRRTDVFFCSALVGFIYQHLGLLPEDTEWSRCEPKTFSSENTKLKLEMDAELDDEVYIK